jgi:hypothetical protein
MLYVDTLQIECVYIILTRINLYFIVQRALAATYIEHAKWPCKVSCMYVNFHARWAHTHINFTFV